MKLKTKLLSFVFLLLLWGSTSHAALMINGNLGFTMINEEANTSWVYDLGISVDDFIADTVAPFTINVIDVLGIGDSDIAGYSWSVIGSRNASNDAFGYLATLDKSATPTNKTSAQVGSAVANVGNYWDNNSNVTTESAATDPGFYVTGFNGDCLQACDPFGLNQDIVQEVSGAISMMDLYFNRAISGTESESLFRGTFMLDSAGNLSYNSTVVPIPAAIWMFGSVIAGLAGYSFRKKRTEPTQV